ncbi:hybrid sensor histidine kinase/response regulator, partial [Methanosarcinales archaeon]
VREGEVPGLNPGEYVVITVKDTGVGIPPENLPRIFDPFFTTKKEGEGTGLGLSMVYRYITGMGGAIEVDSTPGEGTKFDLYIPATTQPKPEPEPPKKFESANLLLVEDDLTLNKLFKNYLTKEGYKVHSFRSAREALKFFEKNQPDLAIVDTMLPDVSGDDLVWTIAKKFPRTPIIVISGKKPEAEIEKLLQSGRGCFLMKPFKLPTLSEKIQTLIERRKKSPRWN